MLCIYNGKISNRLIKCMNKTKRIVTDNYVMRLNAVTKYIDETIQWEPSWVA